MSCLLLHRDRVFATLLVIVATLSSGCASRDQQSDSDKFYTYIDATGTPVVIARDSVEDDVLRQESDSKPEASIISRADSGDDAPSVTPSTQNVAEDALPPLAQNPDQLWALPDEQYLGVDQIEALFNAQDRDRFVTYVDETGQRRTEALDLAAVRSADDEAPQEEAQGESLFPDVASGDAAVVTEGWLEISHDCCRQAIERAPEVTHTGEAPLRFSGAHLALIKLDGARPALALPIPADTTSLRIQSWQARGYLLPQLMFLDGEGVPLVHVAMPFSRFFPETWRSKARLEGRVPVEPGAQWVLFFLDYASIDGRTLVQQADARQLGSQHITLTLAGEAVVQFEGDER